ncbi:MAG TPA: outer membrane beta-barrel protein [Opitutaceae bacterium]|nr:outer membrane beta-barrel protein [Lacunisphaera sp.]HWA09175.1 outer membrane beta-barrel protein [Opitutaceae bacterium]
MKSLSTTLLLGALLGATAHASIDLGNGAALFPTATAQLTHNDNIFLSNSNAKSDTIVDLAPGFELQFGNGSDNKGKLSYDEDVQFYTSHSSLNTGLALIDLTDRYDDGKMKINLDGWFHQANQANRDVRANAFLVRRDLEHAGVVDEDVLTEKTSASLGFTYDNTDYKRTGYVDWRWFELPFKYYYKVEPKLDLSAGFTYRDNKLGNGGVDSTEYFYNVGVRGELAPKLTSQVSVGLDQRQLSVGGTQNSLGIDADFSYAPTAKTSVTLDARNNYGYTGVGASYKDFGLQVGATTNVSDEFKVGAQFGYDRFSYTGRQRDDFYQGQINGTYLVNAYVTVNGSYTYSKDSSNLTTGPNFTNNIFSVSAVFRY